MLIRNQKVEVKRNKKLLTVGNINSKRRKLMKNLLKQSKIKDLKIEKITVHQDLKKRESLRLIHLKIE